MCSSDLDNNLYFGTAYGTGFIRLSGNTGNVIMDISAKTDRNTVIYIPLTSSELIEQKDYITFVSEEDRKSVV